MSTNPPTQGDLPALEIEQKVTNVWTGSFNLDPALMFGEEYQTLTVRYQYYDGEVGKIKQREVTAPFKMWKPHEIQDIIRVLTNHIKADIDVDSSN